MTELWVTLMVVGAWSLTAGSAGFAGSLLVQRLRDRQAAKRVAEDRLDPSGVERHVTGEPGVTPASDPARVLAPAGGPAFADREMAYATSAPA